MYTFRWCGSPCRSRSGERRLFTVKYCVLLVGNVGLSPPIRMRPWADPHPPVTQQRSDVSIQRLSSDLLLLVGVLLVTLRMGRSTPGQYGTFFCFPVFHIETPQFELVNIHCVVLLRLVECADLLPIGVASAVRLYRSTH